MLLAFINPIPHDLISAISLGLAVTLFVYAGLALFLRGWSGYEEKYIAGAERTLDSMYLTMPAQHVMYLSFLAASVLFILPVLFTKTGIALGIPFGLIGLGVPYGVLLLLKRKRDKAFSEQLVDSLVSIGNSMKAGFTLPQAFDVLAREMSNPMRQEMRLLTQELRMGLEVDEALEHLARRMPSEEMDLVVSAVAVVRNVGGNLTEVFENIAATIRERQRIEGRISSLTAQGRMQAVVIALLPVAAVLALNFAQPGFVRVLFETTKGHILIGIAVFLEFIGILWIRKIITIDV